MDILFLNCFCPSLGHTTQCLPRTIARWIMSVLQSAGIDTSKFKANIVTAAPTSHAYVTGTPVADILRGQNGLVSMFSADII